MQFVSKVRSVARDVFWAAQDNLTRIARTAQSPLVSPDARIQVGVVFHRGRIAVAVHVLGCAPVVPEGSSANQVEVDLRANVADFTVGSVETCKLALTACANEAGRSRFLQSD